MRITILSLLLTAASLSSGAVTLPRLFQSGMVLQRQQPLPVWGTATSGETVTVTFRGKTYTTTAAEDGTWYFDTNHEKPRENCLCGPGRRAAKRRLCSADSRRLTTPALLAEHKLSRLRSRLKIWGRAIFIAASVTFNPIVYDDGCWELFGGISGR